MASNLQNAMFYKRFHVTINSKFYCPWRGFTLQRGHVYGYSPELDGEDGMTGLFVVYREKESSIILYVSRISFKNGTRDSYTWYRHAIEKDSKTGQAIMHVLAKRKGGVERRPINEKDVEKVYNPPLLKNHYTPMPSMRIPGGSYETIITQETEYHGDGRTMSKYERCIKNLELRAEYNRRKNNGVHDQNRDAS